MHTPPDVLQASTKMCSQFKIKYRTLEMRKAESERIIMKYPNRIPVVCEKITNTDPEAVYTKKYIISGEATIGTFMCVLRKGIKLSPEKALFLYINDITPPNSGLLRTWYDEHKDEDGFLYIKYSSENTFG